MLPRSSPALLAPRGLCPAARISCFCRPGNTLVAPAMLLRSVLLARGDSLFTAPTRHGPSLQQRMHGQEGRRMTLPRPPQQPLPLCSRLLSSLGPILAPPPWLRPRTAMTPFPTLCDDLLSSLRSLSPPAAGITPLLHRGAKRSAAGLVWRGGCSTCASSTPSSSGRKGSRIPGSSASVRSLCTGC